MTLLAKSAIIYLAPPPPADLAEKIVARRHIPIGQAEAQRVGFIPPTQGGSHVRTVGDLSLVCLRIDSKILPAAVVNAAAEEKADEIERQEGRRPGRRWMRDIKAAIHDELLAALLGAGLDLASLRRWDTNMSPRVAMTTWISSCEPPEGFSLDDRVIIADHDGGKVRISRKTLHQAELLPHLEHGASCEEVAITHADRISMVLTDQLALKGIRYPGVTPETLNQAQQPIDGLEDLHDAELALSAGLIRGAVFALTRYLGGLRGGVT